MKSVLILDDDKNLAEALRCEFVDHGYKAVVAHQISAIPAERFDYAVLDLRLQGELGLSALEQIKKISPDCRVVILTGYGSITTAIEAMKKGAIDYLTKPCGFSEIESALLGKKNISAESISPLKPLSLYQVEQEYIDFVLAKNKGNITKSAKDLGLHRQSLQRKLKKN